MDTKWNGTNPEPGEALERFVGEEVRNAMEDVPVKRRGGKVKAWVSFLAFFLGLTMVLYSAGAIGAQIVWERDLTPRFADDWQETDNFRDEVCAALRDFLIVGAGGELDFYSADYWIENGNGITYYSYPEEVYENPYFWSWKENTAAAVQEGRPQVDFGMALEDTSESNLPTATPDEPEKQEPKGPGLQYESDKNLLYYIRCKDGKIYDNCDGKVQNMEKQTLNGFNFYLTFENGKASAVKDGQPIDLYGSGFYQGGSQWFLPGYENYPATDQLDGVTVRMAVRETPSLYYAVDYSTGSRYESSSMNYLYQRVQQIHSFYCQKAAVFAAGILCLFIWFCLRKARGLADAKIASWTLHIWTEIRFVIGVFLFVFTFGSAFVGRVYYLMQDVFYEWDSGYYGNGLDIAMNLLRLFLQNIPALIVLVWFFWLLCNDHRHNPKEARRSLLRPFFRGLRARDLKRPVEKRISRQASLFALAMALVGAVCISLMINLTILSNSSLFTVLLWSIGSLSLVILILAALALSKRQLHLAKDLGRLADQVEAVRGGDLSTPLELPEDADLRQTADSLNDIQAGMKAALEEQTRSERMKVELVSNVSHDIKTPLTSILSYAELLRQEDLEPAAADYARIIDEKAHRLKGMVEDVFEISKAAADQLPVHPERLDLAKLLRQTLADLEEPIRASSLTFKTDLPADPVMIVADGKRLYRVFQNLIDNALRYALEGSRVYFTLKIDSGFAQVSVRNTSRTELPDGVDFTARFVRGDASRTDGGSGLGLSIASSFTQACGGSFRVETLADLFTAVVSFPLA